MRSQSGPLQLAQHCQGFTFLLKSCNEQLSEKEVNKAVMHIDSNTISLLIFSPKVRNAELVWHMMFSPLQQNTYQLQSFKVSYHFVSTTTAYVSKKNMETASYHSWQDFLFSWLLLCLFLFCLQAKVGIHVKRTFSSWGLQYRELYTPEGSWDLRQIIMVILETAVLSLPQLGRLSHCKYWSNMFCKLYIGNNRDLGKWGRKRNMAKCCL